MDQLGIGEEHANLKNCVTTLLQRFKNMSHKERPRYVFDALFLYIYRDVLDFKKPSHSVDQRIITDTFEKVRKQIINDEDIKIDDFVKDMHTSSKRRDNHAKLYFRTVGAHIENECPLFKFKVFKDKYEEFYASKIKGYLEFADKYVKVKYLGKEESEEFVKKLDSYPQAQLRCGNAKKVTKVIGSSVFKGPYTSDDRKTMLNIMFTSLFKFLESEKCLDLPETNKSCLPILKIISVNNDKELYFEFKSVGLLITPKMVETKSSSIEKNVRVVKRGTFVNRLKDIESGLSDPLLRAGISHLYLRRMLRIGDSGMHNILEANNLGK